MKFIGKYGNMLSVCGIRSCATINSHAHLLKPIQKDDIYTYIYKKMTSREGNAVIYSCHNEDLSVAPQKRKKKRTFVVVSWWILRTPSTQASFPVARRLVHK